MRAAATADGGCDGCDCERCERRTMHGPVSSSTYDPVPAPSPKRTGGHLWASGQGTVRWRAKCAVGSEWEERSVGRWIWRASAAGLGAALVAVGAAAATAAGGTVSSPVPSPYGGAQCTAGRAITSGADGAVWYGVPGVNRID